MNTFKGRRGQSLGYKDYLAILISFFAVQLYNFFTQLQNSWCGKAPLEIISAKFPA